MLGENVFLFVQENMKAFHFLVKDTWEIENGKKGHIEFPVEGLVLWASPFIAASPLQTMKP